MQSYFESGFPLGYDRYAQCRLFSHRSGSRFERSSVPPFETGLMWSISHPHWSVFRAWSAAWMPHTCLSGRKDSLAMVSPFSTGPRLSPRQTSRHQPSILATWPFGPSCQGTTPEPAMRSRGYTTPHSSESGFYPRPPVANAEGRVSSMQPFAGLPKVPGGRL